MNIFYRFMRNLVEVLFPNPDWWGYWDRKVLAERSRKWQRTK